jgi:hypothetical protein
MPRTRKPGPSVPLVRKVEADLAYLFRLHGATWQEIVDRFGFSSTGHAYNVVHGGDNRKYAPARARDFKHEAPS